MIYIKGDFSIVFMVWIDMFFVLLGYYFGSFQFACLLLAMFSLFRIITQLRYLAIVLRNRVPVYNITNVNPPL